MVDGFILRVTVKVFRRERKGERRKRRRRTWLNEKRETLTYE